MPKYKISKSNLKEFFGLFGKKDKPKDIEQLLKDNPRLKAIDAEITKLNKDAAKTLENDPIAMRVLKKHDIELK